MSLTLFGIPKNKLHTAIIASIRARALSALYRRHPPTWPDPLDDACVSQRYGDRSGAAYTWVLIAAARFDLVRHVLAELSLRAQGQRPHLVIVAADPTARAEYLARAQDWFRIFGVPFELWLPDLPPPPSALLRFAETRREEQLMLVSPAEAYCEDSDWDLKLVRAAQAATDGVALGHAGSPTTDPADRVPVLAWSRQLAAPWPERAVCDIQWAPAYGQPLPLVELKSFRRRILSWLYRNKDMLFGVAGRLLAFAGHPREGFYGGVNRCFLIPGVGYFVSGWMMDPLRRVQSVTLRHASTGWGVDLSRLWMRVPQPEVDRCYRQFHLHEPSRGYVAFVPEKCISMQPGADQVEVVFGHAKGTRKVFEGASRLQPGLQAIQQIMASFVFDGVHVRELMRRHVAPVLRVLRIQGAPPVALGRTFGEVATRAKVSIIVPLFGRWDFMRYQLDAFSRDPELHEMEWLYVIDDPRIAQEITAAADGLYRVFGLPFRVLFCGRNLGFSGACNLGAAEATGDLLLLLNSDVFPIEPGWLQRMQSELEPTVAVVGARLLYEDGLVQHSGMGTESYGPWGGLDISTHPGKGLPESLIQPRQSSWPAVTAACLLMRRQEYLDQGGLSEEFVIGDFEDADLCRRLRDGGREIRVAQQARLYHLERQSLSGIGGDQWRQWLTLYNCWLFNERAERRSG